MRHGSTWEALRILGWVLLVLIAAGFMWPILFRGLFIAVPIGIGVSRYLIWWYPQRGLRRVIPDLGEKPVEPQGVSRYENWPS